MSMNTMQLAKQEITKHRMKLLAYCLIVAIGCSIVSLLFQKLNNNLIPMIFAFVINLIFLFGMNLLYAKIVKHEEYSYKNFSEILKYKNKLIPLVFIYISVIGIGIFLIKLALDHQTFIQFLPLVIFFSVICFNCINHLTLYEILQNDENIFKALLKGVKLFIHSKGIIFNILVKTILIIFLGSLVIYLLNIFVYAPQINQAMQHAAVVDEQLLEPFFSTDISYLIQSIGMQLVVSYMTIVSGMTYGVYFYQQCRIPKKRLKK